MQWVDLRVESVDLSGVDSHRSASRCSSIRRSFFDCVQRYDQLLLHMPDIELSIRNRIEQVSRLPAGYDFMLRLKFGSLFRWNVSPPPELVDVIQTRKCSFSRLV